MLIREQRLCSTEMATHSSVAHVLLTETLLQSVLLSGYHIRAIFRGGGRVFGPLPRDYKQKVNKKVKNLARKSALSIKAKENAIKVLDKFDLKKPQTKDFLNILKVFGLNDKKSLVVLGESNKNVYLSSRNLKNSKVIIASELNTYSISNASNLIFDESAVTGIINVLKK